MLTFNVLRIYYYLISDLKILRCHYALLNSKNIIQGRSIFFLYVQKNGLSILSSVQRDSVSLLNKVETFDGIHKKFKFSAESLSIHYILMIA